MLKLILIRKQLKTLKKIIRHKYNPYHIEITNCKFKAFKF